MKFNIKRTSMRYNTKDKSPYKESVFVERENPYYEIEVNTLEDLIEILEKSGEAEMVLTIEEWKKWNGENDYTIEIYDDYRE